MLSSNQITVSGTNPVLVALADPSQGQQVHLQNSGTADAFIGPGSVTSASGYALRSRNTPGNPESVTIVQLQAGEPLYAIIVGGANSTVVQVLRQSPSGTQ